MDEKEAKIYELSYLATPTLSEEELPAKVGGLKEVISNLGGAFISEEYPKLIDLAYTMERVVANKRNKFGQGYFGWFKFEMDPASVLKLKGALDLDESIIRFLIIRTVRENTLAPRARMAQNQKAEQRKKAVESENGGTKEPITEAEAKEIDKRIDELVA